MIYIIYLISVVFGVALYLIGYSYSYRFMNKNDFMKENFPKINGENYSFYEIFEIQSILLILFIQYNRFYKRDKRIPIYDEKHNVVMNNFSKIDLINFIEGNYFFLKIYSLINIVAVIVFTCGFLYFLMFE